MEKIFIKPNLTDNVKINKLITFTRIWIQNACEFEWCLPLRLRKSYGRKTHKNNIHVLFNLRKKLEAERVLQTGEAYSNSSILIILIVINHNYWFFFLEGKS